jgi:hypothetical protein
MGQVGAPGGLASHSICRACWILLYPEFPVDATMDAEWKKLEEQNGA